MVGVNPRRTPGVDQLGIIEFQLAIHLQQK